MFIFTLISSRLQPRERMKCKQRINVQYFPQLIDIIVTYLRGGVYPPNLSFFHSHFVEQMKLHISCNFYDGRMWFGGMTAITSYRAKQSSYGLTLRKNFKVIFFVQFWHSLIEHVWLPILWNFLVDRISIRREKIILPSRCIFNAFQYLCNSYPRFREQNVWRWKTQYDRKIRHQILSVLSGIESQKHRRKTYFV